MIKGASASLRGTSTLSFSLRMHASNHIQPENIGLQFKTVLHFRAHAQACVSVCACVVLCEEPVPGATAGGIWGYRRLMIHSGPPAGYRRRAAPPPVSPILTIIASLSAPKRLHWSGGDRERGRRRASTLPSRASASPLF